MFPAVILRHDPHTELLAFRSLRAWGWDLKTEGSRWGVEMKDDEGGEKENGWDHRSSPRPIYALRLVSWPSSRERAPHENKNKIKIAYI